MSPQKILLLASGLALLGACSDSSDTFVTATPEPAPTLSAEIRRTEYGIPHITANDWASLGYGFGYAYAQDNYCITMREIVFAVGRSAELLGEAEGNVDSDFLFRFINGDKEEFRQNFVESLPEFAQELGLGYTKGMNRYLADTGLENLAEGDRGCRNADWVFAFDDVDLALFLRREALRGSSDQGLVRSAMNAVTGPSANPAAASSPEAMAEASKQLQKAARQLRQHDGGSNGLALGRDATVDGSGMLLGNPHQPWFGAGAWYQAHLTLPGVYDVAGAALHGFPFIGIGFNRDVAWTHTVSLANRFSFYELKLNPNNPLQYDYNGEWRDIDQEVIQIQVKLADGSLETREKTFYSSQYGPIVNLKDVSPLLDGWPMFNGSILAFRDANLNTGVRGIEQWITKGQATNMDEYVDALSVIGNPVFHDLAVDRAGNAFYGEVSAIPFLTQTQLDNCVKPPIGTLLAQATTNVILSLDGSDPDCEWGTDESAPAGSNLYGAAALPQLRTTDYVSNSNNSYWLSDANQPLTGFPTIMGPVGYEGLQQFLRTRLGHLMVTERKQASDGFSETPLFDLQTMKQMMYSNRVYGAELVLADVLEICQAYLLDNPGNASLASACNDVLPAWDQHVDLDSRGAQVFTEFWRQIRNELGNDFQNIVESDSFWAIDYDAADPLNTPAGINTSLPANQSLVIDALLAALERLDAAGVAIDAPWGEIQYLERGNENVPIHGGAGTMGVYGAISVGLREGGYINPGSGNSYIQAVTWDESECPIADVILVPSQSTDPASPHFADQTKLYSDKQWVRFPFCEADIAASQIGETLILEE